MPGNALPFVGNFFYVFDIVFANTLQIQNNINIKYKCMPFCIFN